MRHWRKQIRLSNKLLFLNSTRSEIFTFYSFLSVGVRPAFLEEPCARKDIVPPKLSQSYVCHTSTQHPLWVSRNVIFLEKEGAGNYCSIINHCVHINLVRQYLNHVHCAYLRIQQLSHDQGAPHPPTHPPGPSPLFPSWGVPHSVYTVILLVLSRVYGTADRSQYPPRTKS